MMSSRELVVLGVAMLLAVHWASAKPVPPIKCGSNLHGPSNSPVCIYIKNNSTRVKQFTLVGSGTVNTSFLAGPPQTWGADLWYSMHDGEIWSPPGLDPFTSFVRYTGVVAPGTRRDAGVAARHHHKTLGAYPLPDSTVMELEANLTLTGDYDLSFAVTKGWHLGAYGGPNSPAGQSPFVMALILNDAE